MSSLLYLSFLYLRQVRATLPCSMQASHWGGFSCWGHTGSRAWTSAVAAFWLNCSQPRGILLHPRSNLYPLPWQADSHPLYHQGNPLAECILTPNLIWPRPISQAKSCVVSTVPLSAQTHSIEFLGEVTLSSVDLCHTVTCYSNFRSHLQEAFWGCTVPSLKSRLRDLLMWFHGIPALQRSLRIS